jgi:hypothetical protein
MVSIENRKKGSERNVCIRNISLEGLGESLRTAERMKLKINEERREHKGGEKRKRKSEKVRT